MVGRVGDNVANIGYVKESAMTLSNYKFLAKDNEYEILFYEISQITHVCQF